MKSFVVYYSFLTIVAAFLLGFSPSSQAQDAIPDLPEPIQNLVNEGAQIRYLGRDYGFDSWLTVKNGQEQYFYVKPDGSAFVMGVLFDNKGKLVTVNQVQRLRSEGDDLLDVLTEDSLTGFGKADAKKDDKRFASKSPSEQLFSDLENSNWVTLGDNKAPVLYSFIDPQCPHCHSFINDIRPAIERGAVQVRIIPVGFKEETRAQAAFLIAAPDPEDRWYKHMAGDESALPAKSEINQQGVQRNLAVMQSWKLNVTPMIAYRSKDGTIKLVRGKPKDLNSILSDLQAGS